MVYGAGAIGGDLATLLITSGHNVTIVAKSDRTHEVLTKGGICHSSKPSGYLRWISPERYNVVQSPSEAAKQDYIFLTTPVEALREVSLLLPDLFKDNFDTKVVSLSNGLPCWYHHQLPLTSAVQDLYLPGLDDRVFLRNVPPEKLVGGVIRRAVTRTVGSRLTIQHFAGEGYELGKLDHERIDPNDPLIDLLVDEYGQCTIKLCDDIHGAYWNKLIGTIAFSLSVLEEKTVGELARDPISAAKMVELASEVLEIGVQLGALKPEDFNLDREVRKLALGPLRDHELSMLRSYRAGEPVEVEGSVGAVLRLGTSEALDCKVSALRELHFELLRKPGIIVNAPDLDYAFRRTGRAELIQSLPLSMAR